MNSADPRQRGGSKKTKKCCQNSPSKKTRVWIGLEMAWQGDGIEVGGPMHPLRPSVPTQACEEKESFLPRVRQQLRADVQTT